LRRGTQAAQAQPGCGAEYVTALQKTSGALVHGESFC